MRQKLLASSAFVAALGLATPATAENITYIDEHGNQYGNQADLDIIVQIEEIAELEIDRASATVVVSDGDNHFMDNPAFGMDYLANMAKMTLRSNYQVNAVKIAFPQRGGLRGTEHATLGEATCNEEGGCNGSSAIGVLVGVSILDAGGKFIMGDHAVHSGESPINYRGSKNGDYDLVSPGEQGLAIGVTANWRWTFTNWGEATFAGAGTYTIPITAMIVPGTPI